MKSLEFFKRTLATTLAIVLACLLSVRPAQAGYTVTLQQVGPDVVATGSGAINLHGLTFSQSTSKNPVMSPHTPSGFLGIVEGAIIYTGPISSSVDVYSGGSGPTSFGNGFGGSASSGSGDMVGISTQYYKEDNFYTQLLRVPAGYVSGTALSDSATYSNTTLADLGVTQGTYVWTWGTTANQNFTLQIPSFPPPPPPPTPCPSATPRPASQAQLLNISTRMDVQTGGHVLIGGFIVTGNVAKRVMLRAIGPSLTQFSIVGALGDPVLELHASDGSLITSNDNWKETQQTDIEAAGFAPQDDLESAIIATLDPGLYTAIVSDKNGSSGVGLVEGYDVDQAADAQVANFSTRGFVEAGSNVMIGGVILGNGSGTTNILVRALGPSLSQLGVSDTLADPTLELHDANGAIVMSNDNWKDTQECELEGTGIPPSNDLESAMIVTIPTGAYTAIVTGNNNGTGVALVEVYRLP